MAKIDYNQLKILIARPLEQACRQKAIAMAEEKFQEAKADFLQMFLSDPTTQEIQAGGEGLFGFIGFDVEEDSDPIGTLYEYLEDSITLNRTPIYDKNKLTYSFIINAPSKDEIADITPMPWGTHRSWVFAIETGISGLSHYLAQSGLGRSLAGVQTRGNAKGGNYTPKKYMSAMLAFLRASLE